MSEGNLTFLNRYSSSSLTIFKNEFSSAKSILLAISFIKAFCSDL